MLEDEENKKEIKEVEVEGKIKLVTSSHENSRNDIDLQTKPDDKPDYTYKSTIDEPIIETLVPYFFSNFSNNSLDERFENGVLQAEICTFTKNEGGKRERTQEM